MAIRIITGQIAVFQPQNTFKTKDILQIGFQFFLLQIFVPVHRRKTFDGSEQRSFAIRFDTAAFQYERLHVDNRDSVGKSTLHRQIACNQIIQICHIFHSPPVEHKVIHGRFPLVEYGNATMITSPSIIRRHLPENDPAVIHIA